MNVKKMKLTDAIKYVRKQLETITEISSVSIRFRESYDKEQRERGINIVELLVFYKTPTGKETNVSVDVKSDEDNVLERLLSEIKFELCKIFDQHQKLILTL